MTALLSSVMTSPSWRWCTARGEGLPEAATAMWRLGLKWDIPAERMSYDRLGLGRTMPNHLAKHGLAAPWAMPARAGPASSRTSRTCAPRRRGSWASGSTASSSPTR